MPARQGPRRPVSRGEGWAPALSSVLDPAEELPEAALLRRYAAQTTVPIERSRAEMERTLGRYGADSFAYATNKRRAMVTFKMQGRVIRFVLELPEFERFRATPRGRRRRSDDDAYRHWEQACRQSWRALALVVKAKLEAVESGIAAFETEFLPYTVLPNGKTVGDWALPQVARAYETGKMPALLPAYLEATE